MYLRLAVRVRRSLLLLVVGLLATIMAKRYLPSHGNPGNDESAPETADYRLIQSSRSPDPAGLEESGSVAGSASLEHAIEAAANSPVGEATHLPELPQRDDNRGEPDLQQWKVASWAETDPVAAAGWASELPEGLFRQQALEQVAIAWANTDVAAAAKWVSGLPQTSSGRAAVLALANEAARQNPTLALEAAGALAPSPERDDSLVHALSQWVVTEPAAAQAWTMRLPDSELKQRLVAALAIGLAEQDGAAAADLASSSLPGGEEQDRAAVAIVQRWAQHNPQAAADWVARFPTTPVGTAAVQNLVALWTTQDGEAVARWLRQLPSGPLRDAGVQAYSTSQRTE